MESLRELFKIGNGPSSSHTMGPKKAAELFLRRCPGAESYRVTLYGSLAATGRGHLTDQAILASMTPHAPTEIVWRPDIVPAFHPNGMLFEGLRGEEVIDSWTIYSIGGGALANETTRQEPPQSVYPLSTMGAHVSDCPNHTVGRTTPFETRGYVALAGTFGYELDVTKIPEADRNMIPDQVAMYHKYNDLVRQGDYYRIARYADNHFYDCYAVVAKDKSEALVTYVQVLNRPNYHSRRICIPGLDPEKTYVIENAADWQEIRQTEYRGDALHYAGINIPPISGDFKARLMHLRER